MNETSSRPGAIADVATVRALLLAAARRREAVSYSAALIALGHRFTRPKMRALCRTLDAIDRLSLESGEPELAVLVVREADGLPGQGWWAEGRPMRHDYAGPWRGPEALAFVRGLQARAFDAWAGDDTSAGDDTRAGDMERVAESRLSPAATAAARRAPPAGRRGSRRDA